MPVVNFKINDKNLITCTRQMNTVGMLEFENKIANYIEKTNKYHGQYHYKIGFGGNIIEYPPNLLLIINKPIYQTYQQACQYDIPQTVQN